MEKTLTKAEEQVMRYLWKLQKAFLKDVVEMFPEPKPAPTTVATVIQVLVKKGFAGFKKYNKMNEYYPVISKSDYFSSQLRTLIGNFFNGSRTDFASFFTNNEDLDLSELQEIKKIVEEEINRKKNK